MAGMMCKKCCYKRGQRISDLTNILDPNGMCIIVLYALFSCIVCVCTCVYVHVCMCMYMCVCTCVYVYVHVCMYMCVCTCLCTCLCTCVCV